MFTVLDWDGLLVLTSICFYNLIRVPTRPHGPHYIQRWLRVLLQEEIPPPLSLSRHSKVAYQDKPFATFLHRLIRSIALSLSMNTRELRYIFSLLQFCANTLVHGCSFDPWLSLKCFDLRCVWIKPRSWHREIRQSCIDWPWPLDRLVFITIEELEAR